MVAGDKHLILHTPEEDVSLVVRLAVWTLSSIFDLPTHKVKIRSRPSLTTRSTGATPRRDPNFFLRSLFLPSTRRDAFDQSRPSVHSRTRSGKRRSSYLRSVSIPNDLSVFGNLPPAVGLSGTSVDEQPRNLVRDAGATLPIVAPQPRPFIHAHTEPLPISRSRTQPEFPHALVLSGLDHANLAEQASLTDILAHRQVVIGTTDCEGSYTGLSDDLDYEGTWNVPEGFISIYVCPWDSRERPKIHKSLLDQFAMSSTIFVHQHTRQALRTLPFTSNSISHLRLHSYSHSNPPTPSLFQSPSLPSPRTPPMSSHTLPGNIQPQHHPQRNSHAQPPPPPIVPKQLLPREFLLFLRSAAQGAHVSSILSLYLSDLFSAVRHHPKLDGSLLTARSMNDASALARAGRVLGVDPTGGELLRDYHGVETFEDEENSDADGEHRSFHGYDDIASGSESVTINVPRGKTLSQGSLATSIKDLDHTSAGAVDELVQTLYVSEADFARIVPRVVTHRLRVRDGPEDELLASAMFGATFESPLKRPTGPSNTDYDWETRNSIKDILVEILAEV
ncbi:hypothetical protein FPV67DRAFT_1485989 [Lyophyllum atratum]|nr:hypothetical protein FPV67DRAFT_1485989 [Lyophyllum atratum]